MASSSAAFTTPQPTRGPLSHIADALRFDNRQLLLETLCRDPRFNGCSGNHDNDYDDDDNINIHAGGGGADSAAGGGGFRDDAIAPGKAVGGASKQRRQPPAEQQLLFGSSDLRRVILHQVMHNRHNNDNSNNNNNNNNAGTKKTSSTSKKKGKKGKHNVAQLQEEEEIIRDWNEELLSLHSSTKIVGTNVLSPLGDGAVISPHGSNANSGGGGNSNKPGQGRSSGFNPFGNDDDDDDAGGDVDDELATNNNVPLTTYVLRGGGFDLPSLSAAALHRRKALLAASSSAIAARTYQSRDHHPSLQQQQQQQRPERAFRFVFVPRMTEMERAFLNELGVADDGDNAAFGGGSGKGTGRKSTNSFESLPIDLIPLDDDVFSLELAGGGASSGAFSHNGASATTAGGINESDESAGGNALSPPSAACMRHSDIEGCEADVADVVARSLLKLQLLNRCGTDNINDAAAAAVENSGGNGNGNGNGSDDPSSLKGAIGRVQGLGPLATAVIDRMMTLRMEEERLDAQEAEDEAEENEEHDNDMEMADSNDGMDQDEVVNAAEGVEITTAHGNNNHRQGPTKAMDDNGGQQSTPSIQALLVIDRKIDLVTPMLTPLTYEGLIDDVLQIRVGGCVSVKKSVLEPDDENEDDDGRGNENRNNDDHDPTVLVPLDDSDPLYTQVRDKHVETFGSFLQNQAKALKESHSQFTNRDNTIKSRDLTEIHQFVKQIPVFTRNLRSLTNHIHIAELVKSAAEATSFRQRWQVERSMLESEPCYDALEDLIASGEPPYRWLRLFCLQSLTSNGIKAARYDSLRREVVQTYGYEYLMVLNDLEKAGLLRKRETFFMDSMATPYSTLRKALELIKSDGSIDPGAPEDAAYASSGYAPMTVRWVQAAMRGYGGLEEAMKELPVAGGAMGSGGGGGTSGAAAGGRWVDIEQRSTPESLVEALKRKRGVSLGTLAKNWSESEAPSSRSAADEATSAATRNKKPVLLVYFVGGVTFMELAGLRLLSRKPSFPYDIVCCTTEIVNGGTLLRSLSC